MNAEEQLQIDLNQSCTPKDEMTLPRGSASPLATIRNCAGKILQCSDDVNVKDWAREIQSQSNKLLEKYWEEQALKSKV